MLPQNHRELHRKTRALSSLCVDESLAAKLTYSILDLWLKDQYPTLTTGLGLTQFEANKAVRSFTEELRRLPFIEAAFWLSCGYATWVGKKSRKEKAMFFTPPKLAEHVIDTLITQGASLVEHRWFDPACGGAAFIAPLAAKMRQKLIELGKSPDEILDIAQQNIVGIDIDETLQALASIFVRAVFYEDSRATNRELRPNISCKNTLLLEPNDAPKFDVLLCNPPYRKIVQSDRQKIHTEYLSEVEGQHNLYGVFMMTALKTAAEDSLIALLTPTSYISGRHFSKLRMRLARDMKILRLDMLTERESTFVQVEQETAVLYGRIQSKTQSYRTPIYVLSTGHDSKSIGNVRLIPDGTAWYVPRTDGEFRIFDRYSKAPFRLHHYGYIVKTGPLVWNRDKKKKLFSDADVKSAKLPVPVIWSSNITAAGKFEFGRGSGQKDYFSFVDFDNNSNQGLIRKECIVLQRVTSADQNRRLVAAVVPADFIEKYQYFVAENHVITIVPSAPRVKPEHIRDLLMSQEVDLLFRCLSGTVGVTLFELEQLPLPDPSKLVEELQTGKSIEEAVSAAYKQSITELEPTYGT